MDDQNKITGFGGSPRGSEMFGDYPTTFAVQKVLKIKYNVLKSVEKQLVCRYKTTTLKIEQSKATGFGGDVRGSTMFGDYTESVPVQNTLKVKYFLNGRIVNTLKSKYKIRQLVSNTLKSKYKIRTNVSKSLKVKRTNYQSISNSIKCKYKVSQFIQHNIVLKRNISGLVQNTLKVKYKISQNVKRDLKVLWQNEVKEVQNAMLVKVYAANGTYKKTINNIINEIKFTEKINDGQGELDLQFADSFDSNTNIDFCDIIKVYRIDKYNPSGSLIYSGTVKEFRPVIDSNENSYTITCEGLVSELKRDLLRTGKIGFSNLSFEFNNWTISDIIKYIINNYRTNCPDPLISWTSESIQNTDIKITTTIEKSTHFDAITDLMEYMPPGRYFFVDKNGLFHFKYLNKNNTFTFGKDILKIEVNKTTQGLKNLYFLNNGKDKDDIDYLETVIESEGSQSLYKIRADAITDSKLEYASLLQYKGNASLEQNRNPFIEVQSFDVDSNPNIEIGNTCKIRNINKDNNIFADDMIIVEKQYSTSTVSLKITRKDTDFSILARTFKTLSERITDVENYIYSGSVSITSSDQLANNIVTADILAPFSVLDSHLAQVDVENGYYGIGFDKLYQGTQEIHLLKANQIAADQINAGHIVAGSIIAKHIGTNEIVTNVANIKNGTIINAHIYYLSAEKLTTGNINTSIVTIGSGSGKSYRDSDGLHLGSEAAITWDSISGKPSDENLLNGYQEWGQISGIPSNIYNPSYITSTKITSTIIESPVIDSNYGYIRGILKVGSEGVIVDGTTKKIYSSNFSAGDAGWMISNEGDAEFNNITIRGTVMYGGQVNQASLVGNTITGGNIYGTTIQTSTSDQDNYVRIGKDGGFGKVKFYDDGNFAGAIYGDYVSQDGYSTTAVVIGGNMKVMGSFSLFPGYVSITGKLRIPVGTNLY